MRPTTLLLLIAALALATFHILALTFYLYWQFLWFDIPMHALGGAVVALSLFFLRDLRVPYIHHVLRPMHVLGIVLAVGLFWEYFELVNGLTTTYNYWQDTFLDLVMDLLGGWIGYIVGTRVETLE